MAVIGTIRKQSGLLIIIVGVALAAFVLGDFLKPGSGSRNINIAEIYGEEVSYSQFDAMYEQNLENQKANQNKENFTADEIFRLRQQTWDQMIQKIVLEKEFEELGITVTAEELFDQIQGDEPHAYILQYFVDPQTQQYNPELVRNYIKNLDQMDAASRVRWDQFVDAIKEEHISSKYKNLLSKGYYMPDTFMYKDFDEKKTTAQIRLVGAKYNTVDDSLVTVTDADFKKYYEDYKQNYDQEATRELDYVVFNVRPSAKDRKNVKEDVYKIFEDFKTTENAPLFVNAESDNKYDSTFYKEGELTFQIDSIMFNSEVGTYVDPYLDNNVWHMAQLVDVQFRPDSMKASHILIGHTQSFRAGQDVTRTHEEAKVMADSLLEVISSAPDQLEILAKTISDDPSAAENGGDLDWFKDGDMVFPFNQTVLTHDVGDIIVVESMFGFHIVKVSGKLEPVKKVRVAIVDVAINPSQETYQDYYSQASEFQGNAADLEAFDTLATSMGYSKRSTSVQKMSNRISGLFYPRQIIQWSFIEGIDEGSVSQVFTLEDNYVVAVVTKATEDGIPELEDLKDMLEPLIIKDLKGDLIVEKLQGIANETQDLYKIALQLDSKVDTVANLSFNTRNIGSYGNEAKVIGTAFNSEVGVLAGPIKGNNAAFFVMVDEIKEPLAGQNKRTYEKQLMNGFTSKVNNNSFTKALEEKADVVDNRVNFY